MMILTDGAEVAAYFQVWCLRTFGDALLGLARVLGMESASCGSLLRQRVV
jgi:hypothetical protein